MSQLTDGFVIKNFGDDTPCDDGVKALAMLRTLYAGKHVAVHKLENGRVAGITFVSVPADPSHPMIDTYTRQDITSLS